MSVCISGKFWEDRPVFVLHPAIFFDEMSLAASQLVHLFSLKKVTPKDPLHINPRDLKSMDLNFPGYWDP